MTPPTITATATATSDKSNLHTASRIIQTTFQKTVPQNRVRHSMYVAPAYVTDPFGVIYHLPEKSAPGTVEGPTLSLGHPEKRPGPSPRRSLLAALWAWRVVSGSRYLVQHRRTRSTAPSRSIRLPTETYTGETPARVRTTLPTTLLR